MPTLDDTPFDDEATPPDSVIEDRFTNRVDAMLAAAAASSRVRIKALGEKAGRALDALDAALKREEAIAEHAAAIARLRKGGE